MKIQLNEGHIAGCGCEVITVTGDHFVIRHWPDTCKNNLRGNERVEAFRGQAVCSSINGDTAVLRPDLPYPHETFGWGYATRTLSVSETHSPDSLCQCGHAWVMHLSHWGKIGRCTANFCECSDFQYASTAPNTAAPGEGGKE